MKTRRRMIRLMAAGVVAIFILCGCEGPSGDEAVSANRYRQAIQKLAELEARYAAAEHQLDYAEQQNARLKEEVERSEQGKSIWRSSSAVMIILAGLLAFLGVAAGSSARNEVDHEST